jgi:hypothetical protein
MKVSFVRCASWVIALAATACILDTTREDNSLTVNAHGIAPSVKTMLINLSRSTQKYSQNEPAHGDSTTLSTVVASVPLGRSTIR